MTHLHAADHAGSPRTLFRESFGRLTVFLSAVLALMMTALPVAPARAADFFWSGLSVGSNNWDDFGNWFGFFQRPPINDSSTRVVFDTVNPVARYFPNLEHNYSIGGLVFETSSIPFTSDPDWTINGSTLSIGLDGVRVFGHATYTINANVSMTASQTWGGGGFGDLIINGSRGGGGHTLTIDDINVTLNGSGLGHTGPININGGANLTLTNGAAISSVSPVTVNGTLIVNHTVQQGLASLSGGGDIQLNGVSTLTVGLDNTSTTYSGEFDGSPSALFVKTGAGTLILNGSNNPFFSTHSVQVSQGRLLLASNGAMTTSNPVTVSSGAELRVASGIATSAASLTGSGQLVLDSSSSLSVGHINTTFSGQIFGNPTTLIEKAGAGTLTLTGNNSTFAGAVRVVNGTLEVGSPTAVGTGPVSMHGGGIRAAGAPRVLSNILNINNSFTLGRLTAFIGPINLNTSATIFIDNPDGPAGSFSNLAAITGGTHTVTIANGPLHGAGTGGIRFTGANVYTGGTVVNSGRLVVASTGSLAPTGGIAVNNGEMSFENAAQTVSGLSGSGTGGVLNLNPTALTINQAFSSFFHGQITGSGSLTKTGPGSLFLRGNNTYTGGTTVEAGLLAVEPSGSLTTGPITVNGGRLRFGNISQTVTQLSGTGGDIELINSNMLTVNQATDTTFAGNFIPFTGGLIKQGAGTLTLTGNDHFPSGLSVEDGTVSFAGGSSGTINTIVFNGGTLQINGGTFGTNTLNHSGAFQLTSGTFNAGTSTIQSSGVFNFAGGTFNAATININPGGAFNFTGGTLSVKNFNGDLTNAGGTLADANGFITGGGPVATQINGNFIQAAAGKTLIDISGTAPDTQFDRVLVTGNVSLAGAMDVTLLGGFMPQYGDAFQVLTYGSRTGKFDDITGIFLSSTRALAPIYDWAGNAQFTDAPNSLSLFVTAPGDANLDLIVDFTDLAFLASGFNKPGDWQNGDFNGDGVVDFTDLAFLASNFNKNFQPLIGTSFDIATTIPEPGTLGLVVVGGLLLARRRR